ncbi:MAG: acyltransferase family protein [Acidimicrobiia bacterium]
MQHLPALDGLRGAAVAGVLLFHAGHLTGGYLGVDAFFVLSGYLITSLLLIEVGARSSVALGAFWARRARRLLPALGLVLGAVALYAAFVARVDELSTIRGDALWTIGYVANWRQILESNDYFALFRAPSPLQHTWSLAIEEQFYVVWPLVVALVAHVSSSGRSVARRLLVVSLGLAAVSVVLAQVLYDPGDPSRVYFGTDTRSAAILVGAALAALLIVSGPVRSATARIALEVAAVVALVGLAIAWTTLDGGSTTLYRGGLIACSIGVVVVIAAAVHPRRLVVARCLAWRPLCLLGLISYGAYLWHWPLFVWLDEARTGLSGWWLVALRLAVTLVVAVTSYRLVEQPIRRGALTARTWRWAGPLVAVVLVVAIVSTTRTDSVARAAIQGRGGVLLVGDSTAHALAPGLVDVGFRTEDASVPGCRLIGGTVRTLLREAQCDWRTDWSRAVAKQHPDVVVALIGVRDLYDVQPPGVSEFVTPRDPRWQHAFSSSLEEAVRMLTKDGAHLVLPTLPCVGRVGPQLDPNRSRLYEVGRLRIAQRVMRQVAARHPDTVSTPDLDGFLCPKGRYQAALRDVSVVRIDGFHYTREGADLVARWLEPTIKAAAPAGRLTTGVRSGPDPLALGIERRLGRTGYACSSRAGSEADSSIGVTALVACTHDGQRGELRVFPNASAADNFALLYRSVACSYRVQAAPPAVGYVRSTRWVFTGDPTLISGVARTLSRRVTTAACAGAAVSTTTTP